MHFIQRKLKEALKPCKKLINNKYMLEQQKEYAKNFLIEIYNQSSDLATAYISVGIGRVEWDNETEQLITLGSYEGFTAFYEHGLALKIGFWYCRMIDDVPVDDDNDAECVSGYFSLYILFFENETKLICEIVKDIENVKGCGGISYEPVNELVYEKSINWQDLNDYDFQTQEYEFFKQAIRDKQF